MDDVEDRGRDPRLAAALPLAMLAEYEQRLPDAIVTGAVPDVLTGTFDKALKAAFHDLLW